MSSTTCGVEICTIRASEMSLCRTFEVVVFVKTRPKVFAFFPLRKNARSPRVTRVSGRARYHLSSLFVGDGAKFKRGKMYHYYCRKFFEEGLFRFVTIYRRHWTESRHGTYIYIYLCIRITYLWRDFWASAITYACLFVVGTNVDRNSMLEYVEIMCRSGSYCISVN